MRKSIFFLVVLFCIKGIAQSNISAPMDFYIEKEVVPAVLNIVPNTLEFVDEDNNNVIDANERCKIRFQISNTGRGDGRGCVARIASSGDMQGISIPDVPLPIVPAGGKQWVEIPITANAYTKTGQIALNIVVNEPNGFGTETIKADLHTHKQKTPFIKVRDFNTSSATGQIKHREEFTLEILVQNIDQGTAENVNVGLVLPEHIFRVGGDSRNTIIPSLKANERHSLKYILQATDEAEGNMNIKIALKEKHGKYAENKNITISLGEYTRGEADTITPTPIGGDVDITEGTIIPKVDKDIPITDKKNNKTFAVIIANEKYESVASVPFALNDGRIFREYCIKTLGIPEKQVKYLPNATGNKIKAQVNWLQNICEVFEDAQIIFYYAGHGIPDEKSCTSYLLPVDGIGNDVTTAYKLDDLYTALGTIPAKNVIVFMDACFSGSKRENGMLASARGVAIKAKSGMPQGNMVVFSAAQGDETAYPDYENKHGMFTYYLLEKLQETDGNVTLQELGEYVIQKVRENSTINGKPQTPCVTPSTILGEDWKSWSLK